MVWDTIDGSIISSIKYEESFEEEKSSIKTFTDTIDFVRNISNKCAYTKNIGIREILVKGKLGV